MPRIYNSRSEPLDFCAGCFPGEMEAKEEYGDVGDGPDGRGNCFSYNDAPPPYEETDYTCERCGAPLSEFD